MLPELVELYTNRVARKALEYTHQLAEIVESMSEIIEVLKNIIEPVAADSVRDLPVSTLARHYIQDDYVTEYDFLLSALSNALAGGEFMVRDYTTISRSETAITIAASLVHAMIHDIIQGTNHVDKLIDDYVKSGAFRDNGTRIKLIRQIYHSVKGGCA